MEKQDYDGSKNLLHRMIGSSAHAKKERADEDFYATDPEAGVMLYTELEELEDTIVDNSVGAGHLVRDFSEAGFRVIGFDIVDREKIVELSEFYNRDFLQERPQGMNNTLLGLDKFSIVMNPPYSKALKFVQKSLELQKEGGKVCAFLKIQFLEGTKRKQFFKDNPPVRVWVSSKRIKCASNGVFVNEKGEPVQSMACYAWFIWEKGYKGDTIVKWFN